MFIYIKILILYKILKHFLKSSTKNQNKCVNYNYTKYFKKLIQIFGFLNFFCINHNIFNVNLFNLISLKNHFNI